MALNKLHEKLKAQITDAFFRETEKKSIDLNITNKCVAMTQYIFNKDPEKKSEKCDLCQD